MLYLVSAGSSFSLTAKTTRSIEYRKVGSRSHPHTRPSIGQITSTHSQSIIDLFNWESDCSISQAYRTD